MSCKVFTQDIPAMFVCGRTASFSVSIDLSDDLDDLQFGVKQNLSDTTYVCYASMADGDVTRGDDGTYYLTISDEDTAAVAPGEYFYEIVGVYGEDKFSLVLSKAWFKQGVINNA